MLKNVFSLLHVDGTQETISLADILGKKKYTVLYFYPKDNTPGCTIQAHEYSQLSKEFAKIDCQIIGVSKDSVSSHKKFIDSCGLQVSLLSDPEQVLHKHFDVRGEKKMYGKTYRGAIRSSFVLDSKGSILHEHKDVQPKTDAQETLQRLTDYIH